MAPIWSRLSAGRIGYPGTAITLGTGVYEWWVEGKSPLEIVAKTAGGAGGLWGGVELGGLGGGAMFGPPGAFLGALALGTAFGIGGDWAAGKVFEWLAH
jgi:hypothetical protein